jgi:mutator protein MutT
MIFFQRGDEILIPLKKRGHKVGFYHATGGKVEDGESLEQALARESREEVGLIPMNYWKVAEHSYVKAEGDDPWHIYHHVYLCDEWEGEPIETESMKPMWFKIADIPYGQMWQDNELWLPQILSGNKVYGEFTYDKDEQLLTHNVEVTETLPSEIIS